jgi:hypothetical protein
VPGLRNSENPLDWIIQARANLMRRRTTKPASKADQIWALWPEIEPARAGGQSMKSIHKWLQEDAGITLSFSSFTSYVSPYPKASGCHEKRGDSGRPSRSASVFGCESRSVGPDSARRSPSSS